LWLVGQPVLAAKIMQQIVERKYSNATDCRKGIFKTVSAPIKRNI
jgi:hypothetical protein